MKFYRVELLSDSIKDEFLPRIPEKTLSDIEDKMMARICVSSAINGCLGSVPWGGYNLETLVQEGNKTFRVYEFEEKDISKNNLISSDFLYENDLVRDALIHDEYWIINQNIKPSRIYNIEIEEINVFWRETFSYEDLMKINKDIDYIENADVFMSYEIDCKYKVVK